MTICPVCEHQQAQGDECDNCGKKLEAAAQQAAVPVERLPELELTAVVRPGLAVQAESLTELELTQLPRGPDLPAQSVSDLERTRTEVGAVPVEALPEIDRGREEDDGQRTAAPEGQIVCRYCRNVQAGGVMCERCGMRLPVLPAAARQAALKEAAEEETMICRDCGHPARVGKLCAKCGARAVPRG